MKVSRDDYEYIMDQTKVLYEPDRRIDTFGETKFKFQLVSELMDSVNEVRIREGVIDAAKPLIINPSIPPSVELDGFSAEAQDFFDSISNKLKDLKLLQYGFSIRALDVKSEVVSESYESVQGKLTNEAKRLGDPMLAVIAGSDEGWEISLLKFTLEMTAQSFGINHFDLKRKGLL